MKNVDISVAIALLVILFNIFSVIGSTNGETSRETDIHKEPTNTSLNSLIEHDLNCTENSQADLKSRRKRYVAFPEGSSFSVKYFKKSI